ncbi:prolyl oligopeptidase family serine peptidase [Duganella sp. FT92W]|uniref:Prolyl oligopeptidase family serine peptidase n=2 Tax=Pseudoduganella rivuli TaxID=2666085 RepID=A0A7X2IVL7_9BURK|nr:prolyl oligopeptidase family serine peptidase [Pseudoduganella rivuli]
MVIFSFLITSMPAHFLSRLCAIAATCCLLPGAAQAQAALFSSAPSVVSQTTCFTDKALNALLPKRSPDTSENVAAGNNDNRTRNEEMVRRLREQLDCFAFTYKVDGLTVDGHVVKPKRNDGRKLPVLVFNRGGNIRREPLSLRELVRDQMQWADQGYIVISSQYRGVGHDEFGGRDVNDVMALLPVIDGMPEADPEKIGMIGISRGNIMTYLAAARSRRIKAIAIWGGVSDLLTELPRRPEMERVMERLIPDYENNREQALKDRSVLYWLDRIDPKLPVLLLHGDADVQVSKENAVVMAQKLKEREQPYKLVIYPNGDHGLTKYPIPVRKELMEWFGRYL